jgi:NDP-sugar pyrophosphorylase family protein
MPDMPDALVLCGGAGLRLQSVTANASKAMADIGGRPFLELPLKQLRRNGLERVILAGAIRALQSVSALAVSRSASKRLIQTRNRRSNGRCVAERRRSRDIGERADYER